MSGIRPTAEQFFDACETGKGWEGCKEFCHADASFSCQAGALAEVDTLEAYADWMQGIFHPMPDAHYEMTAFAVDEDRNTAVGAAVFKGTHTGEGGPVPPTGKSVAGDYAYVMQFEDGKIRHMTKIWNDAHSLQQAGWA